MVLILALIWIYILPSQCTIPIILTLLWVWSRTKNK